MAVFDFSLISSRPAWYRCGIGLRCGGIRLRPNLFMPGMVSLRYSPSLWRYSASSQSLHALRSIVAVFDFAVAVFDFALISSCPAWYRCGIRLRGSGIRLRPNLFTPGVVSLRYSTSLWRYSASPQSLHARCGIVVVFDFAVAVFGFALISSHPAWYCCGIRHRGGGILFLPEFPAFASRFRRFWSFQCVRRSRCFWCF